MARHSWTRSGRPSALVGVVVAVLVAACAGAPGVRPTAPPAGGPAEPAPGGEGELATGDDGRPLSPYTGAPIDAAVADRPLLVVKIENSPPSRPQTGLDAADVVVEEVVEGGVTRFFVLFHSTLPSDAGPVRSARPVDTQLLRGLGRSGFAFSGARPEVQELLRATPSIRITEGAAGFYRSSSRNAPHNLYLQPGLALAAVTDLGARALTSIGWVFAPSPPAGELTCPADDAACVDPGLGIRIAMSPGYVTGWDWDATAGVYRRLQEGRPFEVTGGGRIGAANVVILATRHYTGASGYPETDVVSNGADAIVLRDGRRYRARWSKPTEDSLLVLETLDGRPFPLAPGATWVHLPPDRIVADLLD